MKKYDHIRTFVDFIAHLLSLRILEFADDSGVIDKQWMQRAKDGEYSWLIHCIEDYGYPTEDAHGTVYQRAMACEEEEFWQEVERTSLRIFREATDKVIRRIECQKT